MNRRKLPLGIQTFRTVREDDFYYVDKTSYIQRLEREGRHYFLSRPRRFGKSLFLDTLKELFAGNEALFQGLSIHGNWDWSVRYPVVNLSFGSGSFNVPGGLQINAMMQLEAMEKQTGLHSETPLPTERFAQIIRKLHLQTGKRVVVLIDEYDKPILDSLDVPEIARANRDFLSGFYATIKDQETHIRFSFMTGVTKFSKASIFSGLNNLIDITIDPAYSALCGYTDDDLDQVFEAELLGLDRNKIRQWYNGYSWRGDDRVYNPIDILLLFRGREFRAHWFETGTPRFLLDSLIKKQVRSADIDGMLASDNLLSSFDIDDIAPEALMFQTGYLTIVGEERRAGQIFFRLRYPNLEVRQSLNRSLLNFLVRDRHKQTAHSLRLYDLLQQEDFEAMRDLFHAFYASIPYEWYTNNDIANYEGFYASVFYSYFAGLGLDVTVEDSTSHGRLDMALRFEGHAYIFEFKVVEQAGEGSAMAQLKQRNYAEKYLSDGGPVRLIAVEFSSETRNVESFEVQSVPS